MEVYPNHTFQPAAAGPPRRSGGRAASRVLSIIAAGEARSSASGWPARAAQLPTCPPGISSYPAASVAVEAGVMQPLADGSFQLAAGDRRRSRRRGAKPRGAGRERA